MTSARNLDNVHLLNLDASMARPGSGSTAAPRTRIYRARALHHPSHGTPCREYERATSAGTLGSGSTAAPRTGIYRARVLHHPSHGTPSREYERAASAGTMMLLLEAEAAATRRPHGDHDSVSCSQVEARLLTERCRRTPCWSLPVGTAEGCSGAPSCCCCCCWCSRPAENGVGCASEGFDAAVR